MATIDYENSGDAKCRRQGLMRTLFGPSRAEIWKTLADSIGAQYIDGGFWGRDKVVAKHAVWTITLDTFAWNKTTYTRLRAPFVSADGFRFTVCRRGVLLSPIGMVFGEHIEIGDPAFDDAFIIKSNSEARIRRLLANPRLRELIDAQPSIYLSVKDDEGWFGARFPEGVDELYFQTVGVIKDLDRLESLYNLFAETLDELCTQRLAHDRPADVHL